MKILQLTNYYYPHIGGIEQTTKDIVDSLKEKNEIRVFCFNDKKNTLDDEVEGIKVHRVGCFAKVASQSLSFSYYKELKKCVKEFNPDVIHFHFPNPFAGLYLLKVLKNTSIKLVIHWHLDITKQKIIKKFFKGQTKKLLDRASRIIATSPNYLQGSEWLPLYKDKCVVIPSCINEKRLEVNDKVNDIYKELEEEYKGKKLCFFCGRHVEYKGIEYLINASKELDDSYSVVIGGVGPLTEELKNKANGDNKIRFVGRLETEEMLAYLKRCDVYCFPSCMKNEAFGLALAEAMYFSNPAITFTIEGSGVNYVSVDKVTGIEVENKNSSLFAKGIRKICEDENLKLNYGKAAKQRVEELFTYKKFNDNIVEFYENLKK